MVRHERDPEAKDMGTSEATLYRRSVARIAYMAQDRADLGFVSSYLAGRMSNPKEGGDAGIKRVIRYLLKRPRCVLNFPIQDSVGQLDIYVDSDWVNDPVTRKRVSGGVITRGRHSLHWWSRRQATVALSSCEAELNALVKGACEGLFFSQVCELFQESMSLHMKSDSSAARGVLLRSGSGKLKHLSCKQLWLQEHTASGRVCVDKIPREINVADSLTHEWNDPEWRFFVQMGFADAVGREGYYSPVFDFAFDSPTSDKARTTA